VSGPVWITSADVASGPIELVPPERQGEPYARVRVLVRHGRVPVRFVEFPVTGDPLTINGGPTEAAQGEDSRLRGRISVVVCTRDRPEQLGACLDSLALLEDDDVEFVIVDNSSAGSAAEAFERAVGDDPRFRLVHEPRPGLSRARNRGLAAASGVAVAFTDDDVRVDPWWLDGIRCGFGDDDAVACVTGLVPAAELEDPVQELFDRKVSWSSSLERRRYSMATDHVGAFPYDAGRFGTGANFAVRRDVMNELGGFDVALGAGSRSRGGEDLDAFARVLFAGHALVYEPRAIAWHVHRASAEELARQVYGYGVGLAAYITKLLVGPTRRDVLRRFVHGAAVFFGDKRGERAEGLPRSLVVRELLGCAVGPFAYWRARREARRC
jgi:GT2 family glycosyltransferase